MTNTKALAQAILDMAEKDKGLVLSKLEALIVEHAKPIVIHEGQHRIAQDRLQLEYSQGYKVGYAKAIEDQKTADQTATRDVVHSIACTVLAKYKITEVYTEVFDHGGQIGIAAKHNGIQDSVRITDPNRTAHEGFKIPLQEIENAAYKLANQLRRKEEEAILSWKPNDQTREAVSKAASQESYLFKKLIERGEIGQ